MERLELPGWCILYDATATWEAYARVRTGGAESCGCDPCRNWVLSRARLVPTDLRGLLGRLGIPLDRDCEVYHCAREESGLHYYGGWYHFIGRILNGERESAPHVSFGPFKVSFKSGPALLPEAGIGQPVVQLKFDALVPWLSEIPEAE
jgi:hypothetical protein